MTAALSPSPSSRFRSRVEDKDAYFRQISSASVFALRVSAAAIVQSLFSVRPLFHPPFPLSKCVVGRRENKKESTSQLQDRRVKWTLLVRAIAIQQESSSPLPSVPSPPFFPLFPLSSDFLEQRKGCGAKGVLRSDWGS